MLVALAVLNAVRASPIIQESSVPILTVGQAASCGDPNGCRSLLNIIWSCLFTLLLCTWVSVHPNIPGPDEEWPRFTVRRVGLMLGALVAPELLISWAMRQRILAHELAKKHEDEGWTVTHGFFALMGGFMEYDGHEPVRPLLPDELEGYSLTGKGNFPWITKEEIEDKSKGDFISKSLVLLQTGWFIAQCIARGVQGLPITELELATIAFAVLNFVMYRLWWEKPLHVRRGARVYKVQATEGTSEARPVGKKASGFWKALWHSLSALPSVVASGPVVEDYENSPWPLRVVVWPAQILVNMSSGGPDAVVVDEKRVNTFYPDRSTSSNVVPFVLCAVGAVFGAIHCVAWSFSFPSDAERILWRVTSVAITGLPIAFLLLGALMVKVPVGDSLSDFTSISIILSYAICRVILLLLPFLSLRALSPEAYRFVHWTMLIPHL